jgi:hypothetical protein
MYPARDEGYGVVMWVHGNFSLCSRVKSIVRLYDVENYVIEAVNKYYQL